MLLLCDIDILHLGIIFVILLRLNSFDISLLIISYLIL